MKILVRLLACTYWHASNLLDKIPGFNDEIELIYNVWAEAEEADS